MQVYKEQNVHEVDLIIFQPSNLIGCFVLAMYVDDILVMGSDDIGIAPIKAYLHRHLNI